MRLGTERNDERRMRRSLGRPRCERCSAPVGIVIGVIPALCAPRRRLDDTGRFSNGRMVHSARPAAGNGRLGTLAATFAATPAVWLVMWLNTASSVVEEERIVRVAVAARASTAIAVIPCPPLNSRPVTMRAAPWKKCDTAVDSGAYGSAA